MHSKDSERKHQAFSMDYGSPTFIILSLFPFLHCVYVKFIASLKVLASQKRLENKYKAAQQASEDW